MLRTIIFLFLITHSLVIASTITTVYEKTTIIGNGMSMTVQLKESSGPIEIPLHTHPSPGTVYLIKGKVEVDFNGEIKNFIPGDVWVEPALTPHRGKSLEAIKYFVVYHHPSDQPYRD